ncbi:metalloproteinase inhibitor 2-like [Pecten maximus]|uniref:metalloproteinase inhibitor 2-like n=1 Tax=Pecten maximus TaxID=6579 RepID=UPI0014586308|nr:metalloproteinase inhibitor 2-like [Pecten maximus]
MDSRGLVATIAILLVFNVFRTSGMCPLCPDKVHPQEAFCKADFVIKATVEGLTNYGDDPLTPEFDPQDEYTVIVEEIFKGNVTKGCYEIVWAFRDTLPCGVGLTIDQTFLLSGTEESGDLILDPCGLHTNWNDVTSHMKIGVNKRYKKNCQCEIGESKCQIDPSLISEQKDCFCKYATCVESTKAGCAPECKWKESKSFGPCFDNSLTVAITA